MPRESGTVGGPGASRPLRGAVGLFALVVGLILSGCMGEPAATKAGSGALPVTLRIGTADVPGQPGADQVEHFAEVVNGLSAGVLRIEPVWRAEGDDLTDDWDQKVARRVVSGDLDLGMIPTRAWDTEGITTMRALNAPMLVTSDELVEQIAAGDLAPTLMSGLDAVGLQGLALLPEGIRRVMSYGDPLDTVAGFAGKLIKVPESRTTHAMFTALGAIPDDASADDMAIAGGLVAGSESSFLGAPWLRHGPTSVVGNLPLWPKVNSLVINSRTFGDMSGAQQQVLREAAIRTRDWVIATQPKDAQGAAAYCEAGNTIVTIGTDEVAAFRAAGEPVIAHLKEDAFTRVLIGDIEELSGRLKATPAVLAPCSPLAAASSPHPSVHPSASVQPSPRAVRPSFPDAT